MLMLDINYAVCLLQQTFCIVDLAKYSKDVQILLCELLWCRTV